MNSLGETTVVQQTHILKTRFEKPFKRMQRNNDGGYVVLTAFIDEELAAGTDESIAGTEESAAETEESAAGTDGSAGTDEDLSDSDEDIDMQVEFRKLFDNWKLVCAEKLKLVEERLSLRVLNERLKEKLNSEVEKSKGLTLELAETRKKIYMLNSGTKDLEKILSAGRVGESHFGLGYNGEQSFKKSEFVRATSQQVHNSEKTHEDWLKLSQENLKLAKEKKILEKEIELEKEKRKMCEQEHVETKKKTLVHHVGKKDLEKAVNIRRSKDNRHGFGYQRGTSMVETKFVDCCRGNNKDLFQQNSRKSDFQKKDTRVCYYCGKTGHIKRYCYRFKAKVKRLISQQRYYPYFGDNSRVFVRKTYLYDVEGVSYTLMSSIESQPCEKEKQVVAKLTSVDEMSIENGRKDLVDLEAREFKDRDCCVENLHVNSLLEQVDMCSNRSAGTVMTNMLMSKKDEAELSQNTSKVTHLEALKSMIQYVWRILSLKNNCSYQNLSGFCDVNKIRSIKNRGGVSVTESEYALLLSTLLLYKCFLNELCQSSRERMKGYGGLKVSS